MNATADNGENPELPGPGAPGLPLSAPVAAAVVSNGELNAYFREPDDRPGFREPDDQPGFREPDDWPRFREAVDQPRFREAVNQPRLREPDDQPRFREAVDQPRMREPDDRPGFGEPGDRVRPGTPAPARPAGHGPRPGAHAPAAPTPAQGMPPAGPGHDPAQYPPAGGTPYSPAGGTPGADWSAADGPEDPERVSLREHLDAVRVRAASASSWLEASVHYARLLNQDGVVPVTARFTCDDIEFLGRAREEVLGFAELGLRLLELHAPLDAGGISTDPSSPILRCRSCMWRWPCPTFRMLTDALGHLPPAGPPPAR
jgi:hypothetical protein